MAETVNNHASFIWSNVELLRGDYTQADYQKVILPLVVIRRLAAQANANDLENFALAFAKVFEASMLDRLQRTRIS